MKRITLCLCLILSMAFLASCSVFTKVDPETTSVSTETPESGAPTGELCYFEFKETGASPLPGTTKAYWNGSEVASGTMYERGISLQVETSASSDLAFVGWSIGKSVAAGGEVLSTELTYTVQLNDKQVKLFANFKSPYPAETTMIYHLNGGSLSSGSGETLTEKVDTSFYTAPNTRIDDGRFTRDGYVLLEYNTEPDGTGESCSPGSKANVVDGKIDLYCIWAQATVGFEYVSETVSYGSGWSAQRYSGLAITNWEGDGDVLVIPEKVGGMDVVSIKAGAIANKHFTTLVLPRTLRKIEDGAFTGCSSLKTVYMGDGVLYVSNNAFDAATYSNWTDFRLSATTAPRYAASLDGGYRVKWDRLMRGVASGKNMIVFVSGSSSLHGIATGYLETLLGNSYYVVEYGTIRTTNNMVYMEAIANFVGDGDIVVYAPENSIYQFGCPSLTFKLFRDLEGCQNVWRYIDVSKYENLFGAFQEYQEKRWSQTARSYVDHPADIDENGDLQNSEHKKYCVGYPAGWNDHGYFTVTLNSKVNSISCPTQGDISVNNPEQWTDISTYAADVRRILGKVTDAGATVYFGFCPVNENALTEQAKTPAQQAAFDALISETFGFELLGSCSDHLYRWQYMYKGSDGSDFHLNDYGRAINTYKMYEHLSEKLGITPVGMKAYGTSFSGCKFE
ncbi:MAG: leucine-rich repeat protein [Clostridia bacterium]|nr:leucine-rich repeat protein [Clostridia bacterium]MBR5044285.1 leucine-rich repeat protein [Clostridia bacterium]